jgi:hypothetical protein
VTRPARKPAPRRERQLEVELVIDADPESDRAALERLAELLDRLLREEELSNR